MGGRVDSIELHRSRADIGDVVPSPRRNEDTPAVRNFLFKSQFVFRGSHLHPATASVEAQELICLWMCFKANVLGDGNRPVSYTHLRAHETVLDLVCRL